MDKGSLLKLPIIFIILATIVLGLVIFSVRKEKKGLQKLSFALLMVVITIPVLYILLGGSKINGPVLEIESYNHFKADMLQKYSHIKEMRLENYQYEWITLYIKTDGELQWGDMKGIYQECKNFYFKEEVRSDLDKFLSENYPGAGYFGEFQIVFDFNKNNDFDRKLSASYSINGELNDYKTWYYQDYEGKAYKISENLELEAVN